MLKNDQKLVSNSIKVATEINSALDIKIQKHHLSSEDINSFIEFVKDQKTKNSNVQISLVEYVQQNFYPKETNLVIVPDLSGETLGVKVEYQKVASMTKKDVSLLGENHTDLSGVDFTGSNMTGASFVSCNIEGAIFCDSDLTKVIFKDCYMKGADLRGADISSCRFKEPILDEIITGMSPKENSELQKYNNNQRYSGMQLSTLEPLLYQYDKKNKEILEQTEAKFETDKKEKLDIIENKLSKKTQEINNKWAKMGYSEAYLVNPPDYKLLKQEKQSLEDEKKVVTETSFEEDFDKSDIKYVVDPTIASMPSILSLNKDSNVLIFDPAYRRGGSKEERLEQKQYVRLTREDAENYLKQLKYTPDLSINDFARTKKQTEDINFHASGSKIIADFSIKQGDFFFGEESDLSGLNFSGANLKGSCFAGANLKDCKFNNANLEFATFEGANLRNAEFIGANARDTNLFAANVQSVIFKNADFTRAFMPHSDAKFSQVENSKFNFSDIRNGRWENVDINKSEFYYADLEGVSLAKATITRTKMHHANLDKAILHNCNIIESELNKAFLRGAELKEATIKNTVLNNINAYKIDLSKTKIDELCTLDGADLHNAIMLEVKVDNVRFINVNMEYANLEHAQMKDAILEEVNMKFAKLDEAVLDGIKANNIDMTGANLTDISAKKANFKNAILEGIEGQRADFSKAIMDGVNLRGANLHEAIMKEVSLKKADLRNADLQKVKFENANVQDAKINAATNIYNADINGVIGEAINESVDGKKKSITFEKKQKIDTQVHEAEEKGFFSKLGGSILQNFGRGCNKVADFVRQPISTKWGKIIGGVAGAAILTTIVASVVITGGASLAIMAAAVAGATIAGGAVGALAGHYGSKHMGASTVAAGVVGGLLIPGPAGVVAGLVVGAGANEFAKSVTGTEHSIDEIFSNSLNGVGNGAKRLGENIGLSEKQEKLLEDRVLDQNQYKKKTNAINVVNENSKVVFKEQRFDAAAILLNGKGIEIGKQIVGEKEEKNFSEKLNSIKQNVGTNLKTTDVVIEQSASKPMITRKSIERV
jgi:uncharacterized protein YjbI with pentapeptide repeats